MNDYDGPTRVGDGDHYLGLSPDRFAEAMAAILEWEDSTEPAYHLLQRIVFLIRSDVG